MTREEAIKIISQMIKDEEGFLSDNTVEAHKMAIIALKQKPKIGHWIKHNSPNNTYYYDCSLCGCVAPCTEFADRFVWKLSNFCPDCGAKMVEPQESEDKNV